MVPPVPIPNTAVKRACADGTWLEGAWESRAVQRFYFLVRRKLKAGYNKKAFSLWLSAFSAAKAAPAGIAQLVEHNLAKVGVASSSLVSRSTVTSLPPISK